MNRALLGGILIAAAVGLAVAVPVVLDRTVLGPRPLQRVTGPTGLPAEWEAVERPFDLKRRPIEAASMAVAGDDGVVLAAADGRGYRRQPVLGDWFDFVRLYRLSPDGRWLAWRQSSDDLYPGRPLLRLVRLADGEVTEVRVPVERPAATYLEWTPDSRRLLVAGGRWHSTPPGGDDPEPIVWEVDAGSGTARVLCACGAGVRPTIGGGFVQVLRRDDPRARAGLAAPVPPGTRRLPAADAIRLPPGSGPLRDSDVHQAFSVPLPSPDGGAYVRTVGDALLIVEATGRVRPVELSGTVAELRDEMLIAWTADGIWLRMQLPEDDYRYFGGRLWLVDPDTGDKRRLGVSPDLDLSLATGVAGTRAVPSQRPSGEERALQAYLAIVRPDANSYFRLTLVAWSYAAAMILGLGVAVVAVVTLGRLALGRLHR